MDKISEDLNEWRRTYYSTDVTPDLEGKEIIVFGRMMTRRQQGGITFLILQDMKGIVQVTVHRDKSPKEVVEKIKDLELHSVIGIKGSVKSIPKAPHGAEINPSEIKILSQPKNKLPHHLKRVPLYQCYPYRRRARQP